MVGIVIVTHAGLAHELKNAAEMILGPLEAVETISIDRESSVDHAKNALEKALNEVAENGDGAVILTDLFGGTPTNISAEFLRPGVVEIVTGVNLPMVIKCLGSRSQQEPGSLATLLKDYAQKAIMCPSELLKQEG
ncbi:MAG: PTS system fructose subfamily IIA component [Desulfuromonadales bacterium]|nr:PTS system fructose subfamily IIA component [Desulfuromonadales bacterium]MBN2791075.1 PTS system fructose subfamily IIA component [Desulfuromonadales bacterium]